MRQLNIRVSDMLYARLQALAFASSPVLSLQAYCIARLDPDASIPLASDISARYASAMLGADLLQLRQYHEQAIVGLDRIVAADWQAQEQALHAPINTPANPVKSSSQ